MADKNFQIKNGLTVGTTERISSAGVFTGSLSSANTATTQSASDNSTKIATTAYVDTAVTGLIDSAPSNLNTLNELAAAMNDNASFFNTVLPLSGGTMTGSLGVGDTAVSSITGLFSTSTANHIAGQFVNSNASDSFGIVVKAGNDANDYTADFRDKANNNLMRIRGDGKVGIGTTAPGQKLEVAGRVRATTDPTFEAYESSTKRGGIQWNAGSDYLNIFSVGGDISFDTNGNNVGIGTTGPGRSLHIKDSGIIKLENTATDGWAGLDIHTSVGTNNYDMYMGMLDGDGKFFIDVDSNGNDLVILQNGNVGIGTSSPNAKLEVKGSGGGTGLTLKTTDSSSNEVFYVQDGGRVGLNYWPLTVGIPSGTAAATNAKFQVEEAGLLTVLTNGNVGIGENTPSRKLHINGPDGSTNLVEGNSRTALFLDNAGATYMNFASANSSNAGIFFSDTDANNRGGVIYEHANDALTFDTAAAERMRIDSSGRVGINRTPAISSSKLEVGGADNVRLIAVEASGHTGGIGINGGTTKSRGLQLFAGANIIATLSNQTNVGYVADGLFGTNARPTRLNCTGSGQMLFGYVDSGSGLYSAAMGMEFDEINGLSQTQWVDGWVMKATSSGTKTLRIETDGDIYNVNGTFSSGSDRRIKKEISDASSQWDDVKAVRVRKFKLGATPEGSPHDHFHIGVIAQEIEEAGMNGLVKETTPDDGHIRFDPSLAGDKIKTVKYSILQMKAFKALQEAMAKIETLEAKVAALEAE